ncbi:MAG: helix-turn-helix domain-containing protein [Candidatus Binatus sp.]
MLRDLLLEEKGLEALTKNKRIRSLATIGTVDLFLLGSIARECGRHQGVEPVILRSRRRTQSISFTRQMAMYVARETSSLSWEQIGAYFDRDHSTTIHGHAVIQMRVGHSAKFKRTIAGIIERCQRSEEAAA